MTEMKTQPFWGIIHMLAKDIHLFVRLLLCVSSAYISSFSLKFIFL